MPLLLPLLLLAILPIEHALGFVLPPAANPSQWLVGLSSASNAPRWRSRAAVVAAASTTTAVTQQQPNGLLAAAGGTAAQGPRSLDELLTGIRANAGTPAVLSLLREAVAATGTGEVKREFFKVC